MKNNTTYQEFIPKHKADFDIIDKLKNLLFVVVKPFIYELLLGVKDFNWPMARPIAEFLSIHVNEISDEL